jgi:hypothetical protein
MSKPIKRSTSGRSWLIFLVTVVCVVCFVGIGLVTSVIAYQRAVMPYNSEGNYFDGMVNYQDGAQFVYGGIALIAFISAGFATWILSGLRKADH